MKARRRIRRAGDRRTMAGDLAESLFVMVREETSLRWPSERYRSDPVGFHRNILGLDPWPKQAEILESVRDHPLTTVKSGHRVGKSTLGGGSALWFYSSFEDARVVCTAPTARQVEGILWRETRKLYTRAGRCVDCKRRIKEGETGIPLPCEHSALLDGSLGQKPASGLVSANFREIRGYTAKDVEAITGTAGANLYFILDEASGIADAIYEGLEGNRAGWAEDPAIMVRMLLIGNPTKTSGEFYESHEHPKKKLVYNRITVSSRETPNAVEGRVVIPGLATQDWIAQMEAKYGKDSAFIKVRVDGVFPIGEDGKAFPIALITAAEERYEDTPDEGPLYIGIDPAGEEGTGDEAAMAARRGPKLLRLQTWKGLSPEAHGVHLVGMIAELRRHPRERAIVVMDAEGPIGRRVYAHLSVLAAKRDAPFELHAVYASAYAIRESITFDRVRDELAFNLSLWLKGDGGIPGAILESEELEQELHVLEWERVGRKSKITPKRRIRKELGRSPDRYDAVALSVWEPLSASAKTGPPGLPGEDDLDEDFGEDDEDGFDPYGGGLDPYGGGLDPYGGR